MEGQLTYPQAQDVEIAILGVMIMDEYARQIGCQVLGEDHFYNPANKIVFRHLSGLFEEREPVDPTTISQSLSDSGEIERIGGNGYISELIRDAGSPTSCEYYAQILDEKRLLRVSIDEIGRAYAEATEPNCDPYRLIDSINSRLQEIDGGSSARKSLTPSQIFERERDKPKKEKLYTRINALDNRIYGSSGMYRGHVKLTIADSGHGKTKLALYECAQLAKEGYKILWFQLEDYDVDTAQEFYRMCPDHMDNIYICDDLYDIEEIKREARLVNRDEDIAYAVFDYVQNITADKQTKSAEVEHISQQITRMAKELNMVVNPLSQVTIAYEKRGGWNQEPGFGDVRWSQQLKQDAHMIVSVFRPSRVESLLVPEGDRIVVQDWNGNYQPFESVYIKQCKSRKGKQEYNRMQFLDSDEGLMPYTTRQEETPFDFDE